MKNDSQRALLQNQAAQLAELTLKINEQKWDELCNTAANLSPLQFERELIETRLAYENMLKKRVTKYEEVRASIRANLEQGFSWLGYPFLQTYMSCWNAGFCQQDLALLNGDLPEATEQTNVMIRSDYQQFVSMLCQNPCVLSVVVAGLPSFRRIAALEVFCQAFEDETAFVDEQPDTETEPQIAVRNSEFVKLEFALILRVLLSVKHLREFPCFYVQRCESLKGVLTDFMLAVQRTSAVCAFTCNCVVPALRRMFLKNESCGVRADIDLTEENIEELSCALRELLVDLSAAMRKPPALLSTLFETASVVLMYFANSVFANERFAEHYTDFKLFADFAQLHCHLMQNFQLVFLLGTIVRSAIFEYFEDGKFVANAVYLIDALLSAKCGDLFSSELPSGRGDAFYAAAQRIAAFAAAETSYFLNCTEYHRIEDEPDASEYISVASVTAEKTVLAELQKSHMYQIGLTGGILAIPRQLVEHLHEAMQTNTEWIDGAMRRLANTARQVLVCSFVDGSQIAQKVQLQLFEDEMSNLEQFEALQLRFEYAQTNEILLLELSEVIAEQPKAFEAEETYSRQFYALQLRERELQHDMTSGQCKLNSNSHYEQSLRVAERGKQMEARIKEAMPVTDQTFASEDEFFAYFSESQTRIAELQAEYELLAQDAAQARNNLEDIRNGIFRARKARERILGLETQEPETELDFNMPHVADTLEKLRAAEKTDQTAVSVLSDRGVFESVFGRRSERRERGSALLSRVLGD